MLLAEVVTNDTITWLVQGGGALALLELVRRLMKPVILEIRQNRKDSEKRHDESMESHKALQETVTTISTDVAVVKTEVGHIKENHKRHSENIRDHDKRLNAIEQSK